jgi:lysyl-tRNA synthetase class 2
MQFGVSGANAKPFITHHNDLKLDLTLRVAPELALKRLVVGGFDRVFEFSRNFRNESIDATHNPEFTGLEFYMAYADYKDLVRMNEEILAELVKQVNGSYLITYQGKQIDFTPPFKQIYIMPALQEALGTSMPADLSSEEARIFFVEQCAKHQIECSAPQTTERLIDKLVGHFIEPLCVNPTFVMGHPQIMSPLAKFDRNNAQLTERLELFVNCTELTNGFTELNDPDI